MNDEICTKKDFLIKMRVDRTTFHEKIFEDFMLFMINNGIPYQSAITTQNFKFYKDIINTKLIRLIENFENMIKKNPRGVVIVTKYTSDGKPYNVRKKIGVPIISVGGGKIFTITIDHRRWITHLKYFV